MKTIDLDNPNLFALEITKSYMKFFPSNEYKVFTKAFVCYYTLILEEVENIKSGKITFEELSKMCVTKLEDVL